MKATNQALEVFNPPGKGGKYLNFFSRAQTLFVSSEKLNSSEEFARLLT
jgi:hypothetical protein